MSEEEIMRKKNEKREKFDTVLAYILLIVLLGCLLFMLYLKFIRKEDNTNLESEYIPNVVTLSEIASLLNNSSLANRYMNDAATFNASTSDDLLIIKYVKDDVDIDLNIPLIGSELKVTLDGQHDEIITDVYKEIASNLCVFYGNSETDCRNYINSINDSSQFDGIRFDKVGDNNTVYIDIMKKVDISSNINGNSNNYTTSTVVDLDNTNYTLSFNNANVSGIMVSVDNSSLRFTGNIENLDSASTLSIVIRLYGDNDTILKEEKKELLSTDTSFEVLFNLSDDLKIEDIKKYGIDIVR